MLFHFFSSSLQTFQCSFISSHLHFKLSNALSFLLIFTSNFPMLFHFFSSSLQTFQCSFISSHLHFKLSHALSFLLIFTSNFPMLFHFFSSSLQTFQCSFISSHLHFKLSNALSLNLTFLLFACRFIIQKENWLHHTNIYIEKLLLYFSSSWIYTKVSFSVSNKVVLKRLNLWQGLSLDKKMFGHIRKKLIP
jgi:hypothetical protein